MATGLELPAAIIGIAGVVGIADVAVKGITTVYRHIKELKDVPEEIESICTELTTLDQAINGLDFLKTADDGVKGAVKSSGLPHALQQCANACNHLETDLQHWTKHRKLHSRVKVVANKAKIEKYLANIRRASDFVIMAQLSVLLGIKVGERSASNCDDVEINRAHHNVAQLAIRSRADYHRVQKEKQALVVQLADGSLDELEEMNIESALNEKRQEEEVYKDTMARSASIAKGVVQNIGTVKAGDLTNIEVGMPKSVVKRLGEQTIGDVTIGDNSNGKIGIYA